MISNGSSAPQPHQAPQASLHRNTNIFSGSYHVFLIKNCGDTKMVYRILPALGENLGEETPFSCYPKRGCIYPHSFHAIVVEFALCKKKRVLVVQNCYTGAAHHVGVQCLGVEERCATVIRIPVTSMHNDS